MASKDGIGNQHEIDDFLNKVDEIGNFIYEQYIRFTSRIGWMSVFLGGVFRLFFTHGHGHGDMFLTQKVKYSNFHKHSFHTVSGLFASNYTFDLCSFALKVGLFAPIIKK